MENKRAQVGETLTWITSFLIIFFIMVLFISATVIISSQKRASEDVIKIKESASSLQTQRLLLNIFDSELGEESLRQLIVEWAVSGERGEIIKTEVKKILDEQVDEDDCYVFYVKDLINNKKIEFNNFLGEEESYLLASAVRFNLFSENYKINVRLYSGRCS